MRASALPLTVVRKPPVYWPGATYTVVPGVTTWAARLMVRKGSASVPGLASEPPGAT